MWPLPQISREIVSITLHPEVVACAWIQKTNEKIKYRLRAYQTMFFEQTSAFLVPMRLRSSITEFIKSNQLTDATVAFSMSAPVIAGRIITLPTQNPTQEQFDEPNLQSMIWDYQLLYQQDYTHWAFYLSCMRPEVLFQYKLLASSCDLNVRSMMPDFMANLYLYRAKEGNSFSPDRFGDHMMTQKNNISALTTIDDLASLVTIDPKISFSSPRDLEMMKELLGLAIAGEHHEAY